MIGGIATQHFHDGATKALKAAVRLSFAYQRETIHDLQYTASLYGSLTIEVPSNIKKHFLMCPELEDSV